MNAKQQKALLNVLDYLADEEKNYKSEPSDNHIWLDCEVLREIRESSI